MSYNGGVIHLPIFILERLALSFSGFFEHWYLDSFHFAVRRFFEILEQMDRILAFKVTLRNFFQPLYQDRSIMGFFMGIWWRTLRLIAGLFSYLVFVLVAITTYLIWLIIPVYLVLKILEPWLPIIKI